MKLTNKQELTLAGWIAILKLFSKKNKKDNEKTNSNKHQKR